MTARVTVDKSKCDGCKDKGGSGICCTNYQEFFVMVGRFAEPTSILVRLQGRVLECCTAAVFCPKGAIMVKVQTECAPAGGGAVPAIVMG